MRNATLHAAALALLACTSPASALTISGTYFEDSGINVCSSNCTGATVLFNVFPAQLNGKFVNLTEIGCFMTASQAVTGMAVYVTDNGGNSRREHPLNATNRSGFWSFREPINFKITGGPPRQPSFFFQTNVGATLSARCTIVGTISDQ